MVRADAALQEKHQRAMPGLRQSGRVGCCGRSPPRRQTSRPRAKPRASLCQPGPGGAASRGLAGFARGLEMLQRFSLAR